MKQCVFGRGESPCCRTLFSVCEQAVGNATRMLRDEGEKGRPVKVVHIFALRQPVIKAAFDGSRDLGIALVVALCCFLRLGRPRCIVGRLPQSLEPLSDYIGRSPHDLELVCCPDKSIEAIVGVFG